MNWKNKNVLVVGCGISGISASLLLEKKEAHPILFDENTKVSEDTVKEKLGHNSKVKIIIGILPKEISDQLHLVVLSPGVPVDSPLVEQLKERSIPVIGEVELAYLCGEGRIIAITGTNGKTTTTALVGKIMEECYESSFIVGNIGLPYTDKADKMNESTVTVAEISSFQLETIHEFHPQVTAILNITPDHLDRHHTMEEYVKTKLRITQNQKKEDTCVLNFEIPYREMLESRCPANIVYFSSERKLEQGYYLEDNVIKYAEDKEVTELLNLDEIKLLGVHNAENVMAAIAMAESFGVDREHILHTVRNFTAVEHRIEYVDTINGVAYYNDSKGTNPDASIKAVEAMPGPTILIGGGYDKNSSYDEWIMSFSGKVKCLVLLGQTREKIAECAKKHGFHHIIIVDSLEEAVEECYQNAKEGDCVLLSPACASWGMFPNYEVRGKRFKEEVKKLKES